MLGRWHAGPVPANYFDERIAKSYEARWPELFEPAVVDPVVRFLAELAGTGAALELGMGTGRIAVPLSRRGVRVHGIDVASQGLTPHHYWVADGQRERWSDWSRAPSRTTAPCTCGLGEDALAPSVRRGLR
jgi:hypothetical protein